MARLNTPEELSDFREEILSKRDPDNPCISICAGAGCVASGADEVIKAFQEEIEKQDLSAKVDTKGTGCPGFCEQGPIVVIYPEEICYVQVKAEDVEQIVAETIKENKVIDRLLKSLISHSIKARREPFSAIISKLIPKILMITLRLGVILPLAKHWVI